MNRDTLDFEVRFAADDAGTFTGHAAIFDEPNSFGEIVKRGAFRKSISEHRSRGTKPPMLWSHDPGEVIGVWSDLTEDEKGLAVTGRLITETTRGKEAHALLKAGAVNGLSIGFRARSSERGPNGVRVLTDIELVEISIVSLPAASAARVTKVRSAGNGLHQFAEAARHAAAAIQKRIVR